MNKADETELAVITDITPAKFHDGGIRAAVQNLDNDLRQLVLDGETKEGREHCIKLAAKVRKTKAAIEKIGLEESKRIKAQAKGVDDSRSYAKTVLEELACHLRQPATEYEDKEAARMLAIKTVINDLEQIG
jgi:hypothetical protein